MDYITKFKGGLGPDYVKTICCGIGGGRLDYWLEVDFYRDIDGNVTTFTTVVNRSKERNRINIHLFAEAMTHMSEVAQLLEVGEPVLA